MTIPALLYNENGQLGYFRADGYFNPVTGYGGPDDSINNTRYNPDIPLTQAELEGQYAGNWIVTRGVDIPVNDRLSKGVQFLTNDDDSEGRKKEIEALESDFKTTQIWDHLPQSKKWGRLHGGAMVFFDYGDDSRFELRDAQRGLPLRIYVVDRWLAYPASYYNESIHGPDHPKIGLPEVYNLTVITTGWSRLIQAHESRCIKIQGLPLPPRLLAQNHMWGNSVVQIVNDIVKQFGVSLKAMADTLEDFNWKSLMIENLAELIASSEAGDYELITKQAALAAKNYHNQSIGLHGTGTELKKHTTTVTGLPEMTELFSNFVASAFDPGIPDSKFFSAKGGALAGTAAETDVRNYYKALRHQQEHIDRPHIEQWIRLLGRDPDAFQFIFPPMEEPTHKEELEADKTQAETDAIYITNGVVAPEEVAVSRFSKPEPTHRQMIIDFEGREEMTADEEGEPDETLREPEDDSEEQRADADDSNTKRVYITVEQ